MLLSLPIIAQLEDDFTDLDFSVNPIWVGDEGDFTVNSLKQLQSNATMAGTSFLTTACSLNSLGANEWRFWIKMAFAPSTNNFAKVYLTSTNSDLTINPDGVYLLFGEAGAADAVRLFKQTGGVATEICASAEGQISTSFAIGVKVVRDIIGNWTMSIDLEGGSNYSSISSGSDNSTTFGSYFGIICTYSVSNASKFYFDNFYAGIEIVDTQAPVLLSATAVYESQIDLLFDEAVDVLSAENVANYLLNSTNQISLAIRDLANPKLVHVALNSPMLNGQTYSISVTTISDLIGNSSGTQSKAFVFLIADNATFGDVIITEFMADPSPSSGLPEVEYIEVFNRSSKYFNLSGWKISDSDSDGTILEKWLFPGQYQVLCATGSLVDFPSAVGVTSFPSFNNNGDEIILKTSDGKVIDQLRFTDQWYMDEVKKEGGFSLERINVTLPCSSASNWKASNAIQGGTPFVQNSVFSNNPDVFNPNIKSILVENENTIEVLFSEGMDSVSLANALIEVSPILSETDRFIDFLYPHSMKFSFQEVLKKSEVYSFILKNVSDCSLNSSDLQGSFVFPDEAEVGDLVINEILFEPLTGGEDFVEVYNTSSKVIDFYPFSFGNMYKGEVVNQELLGIHYYLKPHDFVVISEDTLFVKQNYWSSISGKFLQMNLPNYNADSSSVILLKDSIIYDLVAYQKEWQFKLLESTKGKSLERMDYGSPSNSSNNWHTAAESEGFATPGKVNSQAFFVEEMGDFELVSKTVSPDNDGFEDVLIVNYKMNSPAMLGSLTIVDALGRLVKMVYNNQLLGQQGSITWDGIDDTSNKALIGTYICVFEAFDIHEGRIFAKKEAFALVGKL
jgi:hypothetical protein